MKNIKALGLLVLALITGLAAAIYAASWVAQRGNIASTKVVVAAVDIELGSRISPQMLTTGEWPSDSVPPAPSGTSRSCRTAWSRSACCAAKPSSNASWPLPATQGGLSAVIADGKRAMTVRVNDVVGVAGFALPGNYVDVMVNTQQERGQGQANPISLTVLEHVLVLAVAQEASRDDTKPKVVSAVTLELSPEDAEKLDLARSVGSLSLVLRNQLDKTMVASIRCHHTRAAAGPEGQWRPRCRTPSRPAAVRTVTRSAPKPDPAPRECVEVISNGTRAPCTASDGTRRAASGLPRTTKNNAQEKSRCTPSRRPLWPPRSPPQRSCPSRAMRKHRTRAAPAAPFRSFRPLRFRSRKLPHRTWLPRPRLRLRPRGVLHARWRAPSAQSRPRGPRPEPCAPVPR